MAKVTPTYAHGLNTSFKTKNPRKFARIIDAAPKRAIVFPNSIEVKTYNCPIIAIILIEKYTKNQVLRKVVKSKPCLGICILASRSLVVKSI